MIEQETIFSRKLYTYGRNHQPSSPPGSKNSQIASSPSRNASTSDHKRNHLNPNFHTRQEQNKQEVTIEKIRIENEEIKKLKASIRNLLMRMKYTDKLKHIEFLVRKANQLSQEYGYFYITCALIVYEPENDINLSLWIHPNLQERKVIHPIVEGDKQIEEKIFYKHLQKVLLELFPTISLGTAENYNKIIEKISQLQKQFRQRRLNSQALQENFSLEDNPQSTLDQVSSCITFSGDNFEPLTEINQLQEAESHFSFKFINDRDSTSAQYN